MNNSGHRLGASGTRLENTVEGLRNAIDNTKDPKFKYWEFDIRESIDEIVFVYHDDTIEINGELVEITKIQRQIANKYHKLWKKHVEISQHWLKSVQIHR